MPLGRDFPLSCLWIVTGRIRNRSLRRFLAWGFCHGNFSLRNSVSFQKELLSRSCAAADCLVHNNAKPNPSAQHASQGITRRVLAVLDWHLQNVAGVKLSSQRVEDMDWRFECLSITETLDESRKDVFYRNDAQSPATDGTQTLIHERKGGGKRSKFRFIDGGRESYVPRCFAFHSASELSYYLVCNGTGEVTSVMYARTNVSKFSRHMQVSPGPSCCRLDWVEQELEVLLCP